MNDKREAAFQELLENLLLGVPDSEVALALRSGLTKNFQQPPVNEVEVCLQRIVSPDQVRAFQYFPDEEAAALYPVLICSPLDGAPKEHPQRKVQVVFLGMLYLLHARDWMFVRPFVLAGGLQSLVDLFLAPQLELRSQAIEAFYMMTNDDLFDWHLVPEGTDPDAQVRASMYALAKGPILKNLTANWSHSYPGGSLTCLQIFAFFVGWLRHLYCPDKCLRLSQELLDLLKQRATAADAQEERSLAQHLYEDFSRFPALPEEAPLPEALARSGASAGADEAKQAKEVGNRHLKAGDFDRAIKSYTTAIEVAGPASEAAVYYSNRAAAYLAKAKDEATLPSLTSLDEPKSTQRSKPLEDHVAGLYSASLQDAESALRLDPSYAKAYHRKVQALSGLGRCEEAVNFVESVAGKLPAGVNAQQLLAQCLLPRRGLSSKEATSLKPRVQSQDLLDENISLAVTGVGKLVKEDNQQLGQRHRHSPFAFNVPHVGACHQEPHPSNFRAQGKRTLIQEL